MGQQWPYVNKLGDRYGGRDGGAQYFSGSGLFGPLCGALLAVVLVILPIARSEARHASHGCVLVARGQAKTELWLMSTRGRHERKLLADRGYVPDATLSPRGTALAYTRYSEKRRRLSVHIMSREGRHQRKLVGGDG